MTGFTVEIIPKKDEGDDSIPFRKEDDLPPEKMGDDNRTRELIAQEERAANDYDQLAEESDSDDAKAVYEDIADEEKVHAGELLILLLKEDPKQKDDLEEGSEEVRELIGGKSFREMFDEGRKKVIAKANGCDEDDIAKATDTSRYKRMKDNRTTVGKPIDKYKQNTEFHSTDKQKEEADAWADRHMREQQMEQDRFEKLRQKFQGGQS